MDSRFRTKSAVYLLLGWLLLAIALAVNPLTMPYYYEWGLFTSVKFYFMHSNDILVAFPVLVDVLCLVVGGLILWHPRRLGAHLNDSIRFNAFLLLWGVAFLLTTNVLRPGAWRLLRDLYILGLLFVATNCLYLAVIKKQRVRGGFRNLALVVYSLLLVGLLLEGVFLWFERPHRFNGTLASRAWFLNNWTRNEEGYRDRPLGQEADAGCKWMVLGDSFTAGHGVDDPEDRFSNRLENMLDGDCRVYNLGSNGSDLAAAIGRLREYPLQPDHLVYAWFANDIELDGELAGLRLEGARSYTDLPSPARYLVRRSYLLNYLYWLYPHPDELFDYNAYLQECFSNPEVLAIHFGRLDELKGLAESMGADLYVVVFPFLDRPAESTFATGPVVSHLRSQGVPVVDGSQLYAGRKTEDLVVNQNDPHPSPEAHRMMAEALYRLIQESGR